MSTHKRAFISLLLVCLITINRVEHDSDRIRHKPDNCLNRRKRNVADNANKTRSNNDVFTLIVSHDIYPLRVLVSVCTGLYLFAYLLENVSQHVRRLQHFRRVL